MVLQILTQNVTKKINCSIITLKAIENQCVKERKKNITNVADFANPMKMGVFFIQPVDVLHKQNSKSGKFADESKSTPIVSNMKIFTTYKRTFLNGSYKRFHNADMLFYLPI